MFIPYSTDAPLYHPPIATVTLIVVNTLCFFAFCVGWPEPSLDDVQYFDSSGKRVETTELIQKIESMDEKEAFQYMQGLTAVQDENSSNWRELLLLQYGKGIRPWQWLTCFFMHADFFHLAGNMIFLWSFGLLLEGKLGWIVFTSIYLAMGVFQSFAEQLLMFFGEGASLGASGAIFSLLALVVIFAPVNSFETILWIFVRPFFFETPILVFGAIYIAMNAFFLFLKGGEYGTEALHLIGFVIGIPVGFYMLTQGFVDCEGFDIISYFTQKTGKESRVGTSQLKKREAKLAEKEEAAKPKIDQAQLLITLGRQIDQTIGEGKLDIAVALQSKIAANNPGFRWQQSQLAAIIQGYIKAGEPNKAEPLIRLHIDLFENHRAKLQVMLVKIMLQAQRPRNAIRYMQGLNPAFMDEAERAQFQKLVDYAKKQIDAGVLETEL